MIFDIQACIIKHTVDINNTTPCRTTTCARHTFSNKNQRPPLHTHARAQQQQQQQVGTHIGLYFCRLRRINAGPLPNTALCCVPTK